MFDEEVQESLLSADQWLVRGLSTVAGALQDVTGPEFEQLSAMRDLMDAARSKVKYARLINERCPE